MDTIEQNEPIVVEDVATPMDTSVNDTQPTETGEVNVTDPAEEGTVEPTLLAGKYKSPEELEKAYTELQSKFGEVGQKAELTNMLEKKYGMNAQQIKEYINQQEQAQIEQRRLEDPIGYTNDRVNQLEAQLALKEEQAQLGSFIQSNPEYAPFKDKILKLGLNLERDKSYQDIANEYFGQARAQGQQDAYKRIDTKQMTQATSASQAAPRAKLTAEDMDKMSAAELEAVLPWADISNRPY